MSTLVSAQLNTLSSSQSSASLRRDGLSRRSGASSSLADLMRQSSLKSRIGDSSESLAEKTHGLRQRLSIHLSRSFSSTASSSTISTKSIKLKNSSLWASVSHKAHNAFSRNYSSKLSNVSQSRVKPSCTLATIQENVSDKTNNIAVQASEDSNESASELLFSKASSAALSVDYDAPQPHYHMPRVVGIVMSTAPEASSDSTPAKLKPDGSTRPAIRSPAKKKKKQLDRPALYAQVQALKPAAGSVSPFQLLRPSPPLQSRSVLTPKTNTNSTKPRSIPVKIRTIPSKQSPKQPPKQSPKQSPKKKARVHDSRPSPSSRKSSTLTPAISTPNPRNIKRKSPPSPPIVTQGSSAHATNSRPSISSIAMSDLHTKPLPPLPLRSPQYRVSAKPPSFIPLNMDRDTDIPPKAAPTPSSSSRPRNASRVSMKPPSFIGLDMPRQTLKPASVKSKNSAVPVSKKVDKENQPPTALPRRRIEPTKCKTPSKPVKAPRTSLGPAKGALAGKAPGLKDTTNPTQPHPGSHKLLGSRVLRTPPKDRSATRKQVVRTVVNVTPKKKESGGSKIPQRRKSLGQPKRASRIGRPSLAVAEEKVDSPALVRSDTFEFLDLLTDVPLLMDEEPLESLFDAVTELSMRPLLVQAPNRLPRRSDRPRDAVAYMNRDRSASQSSITSAETSPTNTPRPSLYVVSGSTPDLSKDADARGCSIVEDPYGLTKDFDATYLSPDGSRPGAVNLRHLMKPASTMPTTRVSAALNWIVDVPSADEESSEDDHRTSYQATLLRNAYRCTGRVAPVEVARLWRHGDRKGNGNGNGDGDDDGNGDDKVGSGPAVATAPPAPAPPLAAGREPSVEVAAMK